MPTLPTLPDAYAEVAQLRGAVGYTAGLNGGSELEIFSASFAVGYGLGAGVVPELELFVDAPRGARDGQAARTVGAGGSVNLRWYALRSRPVDLWVDWGVGPVVYGAPFPPGGSRFNFSSHVGLGLAPRIGDRSLHLGASFRHISNAGLFGEGNPGLDGVQLTVGWGTPW